MAPPGAARKWGIPELDSTERNAKRPLFWVGREAAANILGRVTHLKNPGPNPTVAKSDEGVVVFLRPENVPDPAEEWMRIFNDLGVGTPLQAGLEDEDVILLVSFSGNEDQASTNAMLDALVDLIAATDAHFEEVRAEELAIRSHVDDWWSRRMTKGIQR